MIVLFVLWSQSLLLINSWESLGFVYILYDSMDLGLLSLSMDDGLDYFLFHWVNSFLNDGISSYDHILDRRLYMRCG